MITGSRRRRVGGGSECVVRMKILLTTDAEREIGRHKKEEGKKKTINTGKQSETSYKSPIRKKVISKELPKSGPKPLSTLLTLAKDSTDLCN